MAAFDDEKDPTGILEPRAEADIYHSTEKERQLLSDLEVKFAQAARHRLPWDRQWEVNWLYLRGEQPVRNLTTGDVFRLPQDDSARLVSGNNVIRPTARTLLGKLTRNIPTCIVVPPTSDLQDLQGSIVADSLLYYLRRKEKLDVKFIDCYRNVITFGSSFFKLSWNRNAGRDISVCPTCNYTGSEEDVDRPCPVCTEEQKIAMLEQQSLMQARQWSTSGAEKMLGEPKGFFGNFASMDAAPMVEQEIPTLVAKREGDIRIDVLDPREVFFDPSAAKLSEAQWWCHRVALPVSKIREMFPKKAMFIDKEAGISTEQYATLVKGTISYRATSRALDDHAYLKEFHENPTTEHPKGRIIWVSNSVILEQIENPYYKLGRFPLYGFFFELNAGELFGESFIEQSAPIQRELNILLTQLREHRELTNNPQWWVPANAGIAVEEMDTVAGRIHLYNPMSKKPEPSDIPPFANYVYNEIERMESSIRSQASITEQEAGRAQTDASGRYAAIIEAESAQQVGPILKYNHSEWVELHRGMFILTKENYTDDRTWTIFGQEMPKTYTAAAIKRLNDLTDIDIQEEDSLSRNSAVRQNQVIELATRIPWLFLDRNNTPDKKAFMRMAGLKMPGVTPETKSADHAWAANIPELLRNNQPYTPQSWDEPEAFAEELEAWLKGQGRNEDPSLVEQVAQFYRFYLMRTQAYLAQQQQQAAQQQSTPSGAGPSSAGLPSGASSVASGSPTMPPASTAEEAQQGIQQADQAGEAAARISLNHEG